MKLSAGAKAWAEDISVDKSPRLFLTNVHFHVASLQCWCWCVVMFFTLDCDLLRHYSDQVFDHFVILNRPAAYSHCRRLCTLNSDRLFCLI